MKYVFDYKSFILNGNGWRKVGFKNPEIFCKKTIDRIGFLHLALLVMNVLLLSTGFSGELCNFEYNECDSNPCLNNGECTDHIGGFSCKCTRGYTGKRCHIKVSLFTVPLFFGLVRQQK